MLEDKIAKIGLQPKEVQIYLKSLELGPQPASTISKQTKISRPLVYDIFEKLIKKGLANKSEIGSITYFEVLSPENLIGYLEKEKIEFNNKNENQINEISQIIPALKSLQNPLSTKPKIKFFEGEKALRQAYEETLKATEPIRAYANVEEMHKGLPNFFPEYYKRRTKAGIHILTISPDNKDSRERQSKDKLELRKMKLVNKKKYNFGPEMNVYDDKVLFASWKEKMAVLITSQEIADLHKKTFNIIWDLLD